MSQYVFSCMNWIETVSQHRLSHLTSLWSLWETQYTMHNAPHIMKYTRWSKCLFKGFAHWYWVEIFMLWVDIYSYTQCIIHRQGTEQVCTNNQSSVHQFLILINTIPANTHHRGSFRTPLIQSGWCNCTPRCGSSNRKLWRQWECGLSMCSV